MITKLKNSCFNQRLLRFKIFFLFFIFSSLFFALSPVWGQTVKISVSQVIPHAALDRTRQGIYDELQAQGYRDGDNIKWVYNNAQGNPVTASQIAKKYAGDGSDLIITIGTLSTQAVLAEVKGKIPIVFASVTDPSTCGIGSETLNVTGVTNLTNAQPQFEFFKRLHPCLDKLGIIYNPAEPNSAALLKEMENAARATGVKIVLAPAFKTVDIYSATLSLKGRVNAVFVNNDNTALAAFDAVAAAANLANIPAFVSDIDLVKEGPAAAALGPDQYEIGRQAGRMVVRILQGESPASIPIERPLKIEEVIKK